MATTGLEDQDRLDGASNFGVSKAKMLFLLDEHGLKELVTTVVAKLIDPIQYIDYKKDMAKAKRMVTDKVWDHIIPHISKNNTTKDMWEIIVDLQ